MKNYEAQNIQNAVSNCSKALKKDACFIKKYYSSVAHWSKYKPYENVFGIKIKFRTSKPFPEGIWSECIHFPSCFIKLLLLM